MTTKFPLGGVEYAIEVSVEADTCHFYGDDDECRMVERFVQYKVNGAPGLGICEWQNRNCEKKERSIKPV